MNKRVFNPRELRRPDRPVLAHTGRASGSWYRTPLDAHPVDGGYLFIPVYGEHSDWVRNVMHAGTARLTIDGVEHPLIRPRWIAAEEVAGLGLVGFRPPPRVLRIDRFVLMDLAER